MTEAQILQLFGLIYLAVGLGAFKRGRFSQLMKDFSESPAATLTIGMGATVVGFLLVTFYGNWQGNWTTVLITVFGWLGLVKGLLLLAAPQLFDGMMEWMADKHTLMFISALFSTALGALAAAAGFGLL